MGCSSITKLAVLLLLLFWGCGFPTLVQLSVLYQHFLVQLVGIPVLVIFFLVYIHLGTDNF